MALAMKAKNNTDTVGKTSIHPFSRVKQDSCAAQEARPYKLVARDFHPKNSHIRIGEAVFGNGSLPVIAGPCAVENEDQILAIALSVKKAGASVLRGGAFKPRTSPYDFQGLGEKGLALLARAGRETGLPVVTEAVDTETFELVESYADAIQIGARNMQNFSLLKRAGQSKKPVILKRGMSALLPEWLLAAEYIMEQGNTRVILCERGIRTFVRHSRNTLDLSAVAAVRNESHLPIIVDPSHAAGIRSQVIPLSLACAAMGVDGIMIEVHSHPDQALSDGAQSLYPDQFAHAIKKIKAVHDVVRDL